VLFSFSFFFLFLFFKNLKIKKIETNFEQKRYSINNPILQQENSLITMATKNTKDNRMVVRATYYPPEHIFKIPDGLDLEDKSVVKDWGVKWGKLYITYADGKEQKIGQSLFWENDIDFKWPENVEIVNAEEICEGVEYSEDEESDDDEKVANRKKALEESLDGWMRLQTSTNPYFTEKEELEFLKSQCDDIKLVKEVFDERYSGIDCLNCIYNIETDDIVYKSDDEFNEVCEECGEHMSDTNLTEEEFDDYPNRDKGYCPKTGNWFCSDCR
jgi:hypothetical protein